MSVWRFFGGFCEFSLTFFLTVFFFFNSLRLWIFMDWKGLGLLLTESARFVWRLFSGFCASGFTFLTAFLLLNKQPLAMDFNDKSCNAMSGYLDQILILLRHFLIPHAFME